MIRLLAGKYNQHTQSAFTLVEILVVLTLLAFIALPFTNMFIFGVKGSHNNTDHVIAYNLARDKIEEIKSLPFDIIKSDFENFREVYQDRPNFDDAFYTEDNFIKLFSDVYSEELLINSEKLETYNKLKELYKKAYLKVIKLYPKNIATYRRVTKIHRVGNSALPPKLKKVTVLIFDKLNKQIAELSSYVGK